MRVFFKKNQGMVTRATGTKEGDEQVCPSEMRSTRLFGWRDQKVDDQAAGLKCLVIPNNDAWLVSARMTPCGGKHRRNLRT